MALRVTPAWCSFRQPRHESSPVRHGLLESDSDSDEDAPLGLKRTPDGKKRPMLPNPTSSTKFSVSVPSRHHEDSMELDESFLSPGSPEKTLQNTYYVPPPGDLLLRQVLGKAASSHTASHLKVADSERSPSCSRMEVEVTCHSDVDESRRLREQQRVQHVAKMEKDFFNNLTTLRNEQRKRQESQRKEFEDSRKYQLQCEQFQQELIHLCKNLERDINDLDKLRGGISVINQKFQEVFYNQVHENIKESLNEEVKKAEESLEQRVNSLSRVDAFFQEYAENGSWIDVSSLTPILNSEIMVHLRNGKNAQIMFYDQVLDTLKKINDLLPINQLNNDCMIFLEKKKILNCVMYKECCKNALFQKVVSLSADMDVNTLQDIISEVSPMLTDKRFERFNSAVHKKVLQYKSLVTEVEKIMNVIKGTGVIDEVCENLKQSLETDESQRLRAQRCREILFFDRVLDHLEKIQLQHSISGLDTDVLEFLRGQNAQLLRGIDPKTSDTKEQGNVASSSQISGVILLGPDLNNHMENIEKILLDISEEHRSAYQECLMKVFDFDEALKKLMTPGEKDMRHARRRLIAEVCLYFQKKLDEMPGEMRKKMMSHILQLVVSVAVSKDILTVLEISVIPSYLCLGSIEKIRIFHNVVSTASPVCVPQLNSSSEYFSITERVRVVALYASQTGFCTDLNFMVGLSSAGMENRLGVVWHWLLSCGDALSESVKTNNSVGVEELSDSMKVVLNVAGSTLLQFFGSRLRQFLVQPLQQILSTCAEKNAQQLLTLLKKFSLSNTLPCILDLHLLTPLSCLARVKIREWEKNSQEWQKVQTSMKKEFTDVKKLVIKAMNQLGTHASGLLAFQDNMNKLKHVPQMQNPDLRSRIFFFLSDKALSTCSDYKIGKGGVNEDEIVAPLAIAYAWLLSSQKGMSDIFWSGLCSYCPFVYEVPLAVSEDDAVNKRELGYTGYPTGAESTQEDREFATKKWRRGITVLLAFYASLIVHGHNNEINNGVPLKNFTLQDAWQWLSRTVNFCLRNTENGVPPYMLWVLNTFIGIVSPILLQSQYRNCFLQLLQMIQEKILPSIKNPHAADMEVLSFKIAEYLS